MCKSGGTHSLIHVTNIVEHQLCVRHHLTVSSRDQGSERAKSSGSSLSCEDDRNKLENKVMFNFQNVTNIMKKKKKAEREEGDVFGWGGLRSRVEWTRQGVRTSSWGDGSRKGPEAGPGLRV